jgi:hypothetical protein
MTINKVCGSGLKAIALGASAIMTGQADVVVAGGMENMSLAPMAQLKARWGYRMELTGKGEIYDLMVFDGLYEIFYGYHMGVTAENIAALYAIGRTEQDELGVLSHARAMAAIKGGLFAEEIVPVVIKDRRRHRLQNRRTANGNQPGEDGQVAAGFQEGWNGHRRQRLGHQRRCCRGGVDERRKGQGAGAQAVGQDQSLCLRRPGSGLHGSGARASNYKVLKQGKGRARHEMIELNGASGPSAAPWLASKQSDERWAAEFLGHPISAAVPADGDLHAPCAVRAIAPAKSLLHRRQHGYSHDRGVASFS